MRICVFFFKQKTAYEMRISDWSSDVCSSDLAEARKAEAIGPAIGLPHKSACKSAKRSAHIDAHVEDRIGGVPPHVGARIELADDDRDVGLQKSGADDDERQRQPAQGDRIALLTAVALESHQDMDERKPLRTAQHEIGRAHV